MGGFPKEKGGVISTRPSYWVLCRRKLLRTTVDTNSPTLRSNKYCQVKGTNLTKSPYLPLRSFANGLGTIWLPAAESGLGQCPGPVPSAYSFSSLPQQEPCKGNRSAQGVGRATAVVAPLDHILICGLSV